MTAKSRSMPAAGDRAGFAPRLRPGAVVAGRYVVVRLVARGRTGEIYEVIDRELGVRVALKTLPPGDPAGLAHLKQGILLARQITHPNVCRLFDVGCDPSVPPLPFLTMELLDGESLDARIRRRGRLSSAEARPIVEQIAAALTAARRAGVVHRRFESRSVILVGNRAVVTDLGLTRARETAAAEATGGTDEVHEADVRALGAVMFEIVTGAPLLAPSDSGLAAPPPRALAPRLDPAWEAAIAGCLGGSSERFSDPEAVFRALCRPRPRRSLGRAVAAAAMVALAALTILGATLSSAEPGGRTSRRMAVAVLDVRNATGRADVDWLQAALVEMIGAELAAGGSLRAIPADAVSRMRRELALSDADLFAADTLAQVGANLGADVIVAGTFVAIGPPGHSELSIHLRLQDTAGESLGAITATGRADRLFNLVATAGAELRRALGDRSGQPGGARAALPDGVDAARLYAQGLEHLQRFDLTRAREALAAAATAEPGFPLAHAQLAGLALLRRDEPMARIEAQRAFDASAALPREQRLLVEALYARSLGDHARAARLYLSLATFFPDEPSYGHGLVRAQIEAGLPGHALATLEAMKRRGARTDPTLDLLEAEVAAALGDPRRQRDAASRAAAEARARGAIHLVADAELQEGLAWQALGDGGRSESAFAAARDHYLQLGVAAGAAEAVARLGDLHRAAGSYRLARQLYAQALATYRELDATHRIAEVLDDAATAASLDGDVRAARRDWQEAVSLFRAIGDRERAGRLADNLRAAHVDGDLTREQPTRPAPPRGARLSSAAR